MNKAKIKNKMMFKNKRKVNYMMGLARKIKVLFTPDPGK
jgi:hypothetical protein